MAVININQNQICLYIKQVLSIWDSRFIIVYLHIKEKSCNVKDFKHLLKNFLYSDSFCTLEEYFQHNNT
jgi:hypothetical protein